jgi:hypothetical protein
VGVTTGQVTSHPAFSQDKQAHNTTTKEEQALHKRKKQGTTSRKREAKAAKIETLKQ